MVEQRRYGADHNGIIDVAAKEQRRWWSLMGVPLRSKRVLIDAGIKALGAFINTGRFFYHPQCHNFHLESINYRYSQDLKREKRLSGAQPCGRMESPDEGYLLFCGGTFLGTSLSENWYPSTKHTKTRKMLPRPTCGVGITCKDCHHYEHNHRLSPGKTWLYVRVLQEAQ